MTLGNDDSARDLTTHALVLRARDGDRAALETLIDRYRPRLRRWASGRLPAWARDGVETEDLVQEALMRTMQHIDRFEPRHPGALQAYLHQALRNRVKDICRRARARPPASPLAEDREDPAPGPLVAAIGRERFARYEAALGRLGEEDRGLIIMRFEWGFTHAECARETGRPTADAARMAIARALMRLGREMAGPEEIQ